ncbi:MAG: MlaD family protein [Nitrospiraceae bacterium]|nr:MlaD family protein [Nitrospiraceae bacterium]
MKEEIKAGIIIVSSLVVLTLIVVLIGGGRFYEKVDVYVVKVMNSAGLEPGAQVRLGGVRVGKVMDIKGPDGPGKPLTIVLGVKTGTPLYKGTKAMVTQIGFVGDIYLLLAVDKASGERIPPGREIPSEETIGFNEIMARVDSLSRNVDGLVTDVNKLFSPKNIQQVERLVGNTNDAIVKGAASVEKVANSLKATTDKLEVVLNEIEGLVKSNKGDVSLLIKKAHEDLEKAGEMIKSFEATAHSVTKASGSVDRAVEAQSRNLSNLIERMNRTTEDLQDLLQEIKVKPWSILYREQRGE